MEGTAAGAGGGGDEQQHVMPSSLVFRGCHLPPGFRFQPTDQEIIVCYLKKKIAGTGTSVTSIIADVDIYKFDPWDLPDQAQFGDGEWFFFSPRDRKYPNGARPNRTAGSGYWKATGTDKPILAAGGAHCLGVKKALVFYQGRSPKGSKTEWVMHEYRLLDTDTARPANSMRLDDWVLCRVRKKGVSVGSPDMMDDLSVDGTTIMATTTCVPATGYHHQAENEISMEMAAAAPHKEEVLLRHDHDQIPNATVDWNWNSDDGHLLQYLIAGGGGLSLGGSPSISPNPFSAAIGHRDDRQGGHGPEAGMVVPLPGGGAPHTHTHTHHGLGLVSVLESIKRNLSFQAIDELYLLQPSSKRANCMMTRADADADAQDHNHRQHGGMSMSSPSFSISDTEDVF